VNSFTVLIIDDDNFQLELLELYIRKAVINAEVLKASTAKDALFLIEKNAVDFVLCDYRLEDATGLDVLKRIKEINPEIDVLIVTAFADTKQAVELMKSGAYDYLIKPVDEALLSKTVKHIIEKKALKRENLILKEQLNSRFNFDYIIYKSSAMEKVLSLVARSAESNANILIRGESGTGKELIAHALHTLSPRKNKPFIELNIAALPESLIESELFGHRKGSFTNAYQDRIGRFEQADGGTLFIDEAGDIPASVQPKLLRAIQFGTFEAVGDNTLKKTDVRIISATSRNLNEMIKENTFRLDLFYRLNVITIELPPLRERKDDIPLLTGFFIKKYSDKNAKNIDGISRAAMDALIKYDFPGNIRELENLIEQMVILTRNNRIDTEDLPSMVGAAAVPDCFNPQCLDTAYEAKMTAFESAYLKAALEKAGGNQSEAARLIGISERRLRSRRDILGL
jgi:DNA-binding NtrC family response regulator